MHKFNIELNVRANLMIEKRIERMKREVGGGEGKGKTRSNNVSNMEYCMRIRLRSTY